MRIRLRTTLAGHALTAGAGDIVTIAPALGGALIEAGTQRPRMTCRNRRWPRLPRRPPPGRNGDALAEGTGSMSILAVTAPAARRGLIAIATVKREFGITGSAFAVE